MPRMRHRNRTSLAVERPSRRDIVVVRRRGRRRGGRRWSSRLRRRFAALRILLLTAFRLRLHHGSIFGIVAAIAARWSRRRWSRRRWCQFRLCCAHIMCTLFRLLPLHNYRSRLFARSAGRACNRSLIFGTARRCGCPSSRCRRRCSGSLVVRRCCGCGAHWFILILRRHNSKIFKLRANIR